MQIKIAVQVSYQIKNLRVICTIKIKRRYTAFLLDFISPNNTPILIITLFSAIFGLFGLMKVEGKGVSKK